MSISEFDPSRLSGFKLIEALRQRYPDVDPDSIRDVVTSNFHNPQMCDHIISRFSSGGPRSGHPPDPSARQRPSSPFSTSSLLGGGSYVMRPSRATPPSTPELSDDDMSPSGLRSGRSHFGRPPRISTQVSSPASTAYRKGSSPSLREQLARSAIDSKRLPTGSSPQQSGNGSSSTPGSPDLDDNGTRSPTSSGYGTGVHASGSMPNISERLAAARFPGGASRLAADALQPPPVDIFHTTGDRVAHSVAHPRQRSWNPPNESNGSLAGADVPLSRGNRARASFDNPRSHLNTGGPAMVGERFYPNPAMAPLSVDVSGGRSYNPPAWDGPAPLIRVPSNSSREHGLGFSTPFGNLPGMQHRTVVNHQFQAPDGSIRSVSFSTMAPQMGLNPNFEDFDLEPTYHHPFELAHSTSGSSFIMDEFPFYPPPRPHFMNPFPGGGFGNSSRDEDDVDMLLAGVDKQPLGPGYIEGLIQNQEIRKDKLKSRLADLQQRVSETSQDVQEYENSLIKSRNLSASQTQISADMVKELYEETRQLKLENQILLKEHNAIKEKQGTEKAAFFENISAGQPGDPARSDGKRSKKKYGSQRRRTTTKDIHLKDPPSDEVLRQLQNNASQPSTSSSSGGDSDETRGQWPCYLCTFLNHRDLTRCELCEAPRVQANASARTSERPRHGEFRCYCCPKDGKRCRKSGAQKQEQNNDEESTTVTLDDGE